MAAIAGLAGMTAAASAQTLVGDTVELWTHPQLTGIATFTGAAAVITPGHEFQSQIQQSVLYTLNVEALSIRLDSFSNWFSPYFNSGHAPSYIEIRDLDFIGEPQRFISGVNVSFSTTITVDDGSPANWPDFSAANVSFTGDSVRISYGGYEFLPGDYVQIDLLTNVPAPSVAGLGLVGVAAAMRRRRR